MLRIEVNKAKPGMKLALPVANPKAPDRTLLKLGYELTEPIINRLKDQGIRRVWVSYPSLDFLERFIDAGTLQAQNQIVSNISNTFEQLQNQSIAKLPYDQYTESLKQLIDQLASHPQSMIFLGDLADTDDDLMRHSAAVTYLSLLMGMKLEGYVVKQRKHVNPARAKEVINLGLGAMLHDVGVPQLDPDARSHFNETGDETDPHWQEHPAMGFRLVREHIDPSAATVVLNHHQRFDGTGYAGEGFPQLAEQNIHIFARIAAVADQFDRLRHPPGRPAQPTVWVLRSILSSPLRDKFDPQALRALLSVVPPYPPGSIVRLSDGQYAACVDHHLHDPCRPTVQTIPEPDQLDGHEQPAGQTLELSDHPATLSIVEHEGHDVSDMNFDLPPALASELTEQMAWH